MKTKEEILRSEIGILPMAELSDKLPHFFKAMDEYAKQSAIAFGQWLFKEGWCDFDGVDQWYNVGHKGIGVKSTEELHNQFLESLNK